jgi:pilus assembly protein Flp/PilA
MIAQFVFARLYTQLPGRARKQRGASALEYIALAAVDHHYWRAGD